MISESVTRTTMLSSAAIVMPACLGQLQKIIRNFKMADDRLRKLLMSNSFSVRGQWRIYYYTIANELATYIVIIAWIIAV